MMKVSGVASTLAFIAFAVTIAAAIGSRLSEQAMTILTGAACGAGLTAPFAILGGMFIGSQRASRERAASQPQQPIVVVTPPTQPQPTSAPALPTWQALPPALSSMSMPAPRQYTILGEETVIDGTSDVWE